MPRFGGWVCLCHYSQYGPAPANLVVPPYAFSNPNLLIIGA